MAGKHPREDFDKVFDLMHTGSPVKRACRDADMPYKTFREALARDAELFRAYAVAVEFMMEARFDQARELCDELTSFREGGRTLNKEQIRSIGEALRHMEWEMGKFGRPDIRDNRREANGDQQKPFVVVVTSVLDRDKPKQIEQPVIEVQAIEETVN